MGLSRVWVQTVADGLVRADSIIGITVHPTPPIAGKQPRWLLDVVLPTTTGGGSAGNWISTPLHRTLAQSDQPPAHATRDLAELLARLGTADAAGVVTVERVRVEDDDRVGVRLGFTPFTYAAQSDLDLARNNQGDQSDPARRVLPAS